jgi:hypothetical protein
VDYDKGKEFWAWNFGILQEERGLSLEFFRGKGF